VEKPHKKLEGWQLAMEIVQDIYNFTQQLPVEENYGLVSQMRRSAISIPSNIAEGAARRSPKEFIQFLHIAQASLAELDTQIELCVRLGHLNNERELFERNLLEADKMISGLIRSIKSKSSSIS
jgi:four helix bundle protein